jgi:hypothetical protein
MINRRQLLINGSGLISWLYVTSPIAGILNRGRQSNSANSNREKKLTYEIWREMLAHKAVGHTKPSK